MHQSEYQDHAVSYSSPHMETVVSLHGNASIYAWERAFPYKGTGVSKQGNGDRPVAPAKWVRR